MSDLTLRAATPEDRDAVMAISATVWEGHDYLPHVWDEWVSESADKGFLLVGESDEQVVAVQHTSFQPRSVAWMEGIRVHPDYRNRGFGTQMLEHAIRQASEQGFITARLSTASLNDASAKVATSHGFREVARFQIFRGEPATEPGHTIRLSDIGPEDVAELRRRLDIDTTLIVNQWTAYDLPGQKATSDFPHQLMHETDQMVDGIGLGSDSRDRNELSIAYLEGTTDAVEQLGRGFRELAVRMGRDAVSGMLPDRDDISRGLRRAGFELDGRMSVLVFELGLEPNR